MDRKDDMAVGDQPRTADRGGRANHSARPGIDQQFGLAWLGEQQPDQQGKDFRRAHAARLAGGALTEGNPGTGGEDQAGAAGGNRTHDPVLTKDVRYPYATAAGQRWAPLCHSALPKTRHARCIPAPPACPPVD